MTFDEKSIVIENAVWDGRKRRNEYRYKLLRDTLRIIETDTIYIPYGVKVADNGKDKSFLPRFSELAKSAFLVVTAALALWVALRNKAWWCSSGGLRVPLLALMNQSNPLVGLCCGQELSGMDQELS